MSAAETELLWTCSADSHFVEPPNLFSDNMPKEQAERLPMSRKKNENEEVVTVDGEEFTRKRPKASSPEMAAAHAEMLRVMDQGGLGASDASYRLQHLDEQGVWGEVVYPSIGFWFSNLRDPELAAAAARVENDFIHDQMIRVSPRFIPAAALPLQSVDLALKEAARVADLGFKSIFMPTSLHQEYPRWNQDDWEPLWAFCVESGLVPSYHIGTDPVGVWPFHNPGGAMLNYLDTTFPGQKAAAMMVAGGVFERHPSLKILISEGGASWAPFLGDRLNEAYRQHYMYQEEGRLRRLPKEYVLEHVYASFQHDETAVQAAQYMGYRNVAFGTDYPHAEGTFPHTQKVLHELLDGVDPELSHRIRIGAFLDLFPSVGEPPGR